MDNNKDRNQIASFLMFVGVLFVVAAGGIFVTTAWKYLSEAGKQVILLMAAVGCYIGSGKVSRTGRLQRTSSAFFYLGTACTGFWIISLLGGIYAQATDQDYTMNIWRYAIASAIMCLVVFWRFWHKRGVFNAVVCFLLFQCSLTCTGWAGECGFITYTFWEVGTLLLLSLGDNWWRRQEESEKHGRLFPVLYIMQTCFILRAYMAAVLFGERELMWSDAFFLSFIISCSVYLSYCANKNKVLRVFHTQLVLWCIYFGVNMVNEWVEEWSSWQQSLGLWEILFISYFLGTVLMLVMRRRELLVEIPILGILFSYAQILSDEKFFPFAFVLMAAYLIMLLQAKAGSWRDEWTKEQKNLVRAAGLQALAGWAVWMTYWFDGHREMSYWVDGHREMSLWVVTTVALAFISSFISDEDDAIKRFLWTLVLLAGGRGIWCQPYFEVPMQYDVEWHCLIYAASIVLLGYIWYDKHEGIRKVQFVLTCCLMAALLYSDMISGGLGNVLILGIAGVVVLLAAAIWNHKEYVIAASVTLSLLVIYITRSFWLSIAWWIYLLIAGIVLIVLAVRKERES